MKSIFFSLVILSIISFSHGCKDSNVNPETGDLSIKFIDAATKQPINNAVVNIYYGIEASTPAAGDIEDDNSDTTLIIYPNPFLQSFHISLTILEETKIKVEISNMNDSVISIVCDRFFNAGENNISVDASNILGNEPNFYKMKLYKNGILFQQKNVLFTPKWFIFNDIEQTFNIPFKTIRVNQPGIIELNKEDFKLISNTSFLKTDYTGQQYEHNKIINGCYCFIHYGDNYSSYFKSKIVFTDTKEITIEVIR